LSSAKSHPPHIKKKSPAKRRSLSPSPSAPEVKLSYQAAGRDTLAAIDEELAQALPSPAEAPVIEISETAIGRETLAAIADELARPPRARQDTLPYADKIKNAPGARSPSRAPTPPAAPSSTPAPPSARTASKRPSAKPAVAPAAAPEKQDASAALLAEAPDEVTVRLKRPPLAPPSAPRATTGAVEIFELVTFIVRGSEVGDLSTDTARRKFVEQHLLRRVPSGSMDAVARIEVTPWTAQGTMVLRLWCRA